MQTASSIHTSPNLCWAMKSMNANKLLSLHVHAHNGRMLYHKSSLQTPMHRYKCTASKSILGVAKIGIVCR